MKKSEESKFVLSLVGESINHNIRLMPKNITTSAFKLLQQKRYSKKNLKRKLGDKGFEKQEIEAAADQMEEFGLIDDAELKNNIIDIMAGRGYGPRKINQKLIEKGLTPERTFPEEVMEKAEEKLREIVASRFPMALTPDKLDPKTQAKLDRFVMSRGFLKRFDFTGDIEDAFEQSDT